MLFFVHLPLQTRASIQATLFLISATTEEDIGLHLKVTNLKYLKPHQYNNNKRLTGNYLKYVNFNLPYSGESGHEYYWLDES